LSIDFSVISLYLLYVFVYRVVLVVFFLREGGIGGEEVREELEGDVGVGLVVGGAVFEAGMGVGSGLECGLRFVGRFGLVATVLDWVEFFLILDVVFGMVVV
ncbi:hypothetical protein AAHH80_32255, partial [Burkholderia pseudomallei]